MFSNSQLRKLILPLIVEQLLGMLVGMMDTVMVSSAGEAAISGVSIVNEVNYLVIVVFGALATGGAVIVSQYLGSRDQSRANLSASQLVLITTLISVGLMALCLLLDRQILSLLYGSIDRDVMDAAALYFWITALSFPFLGLYNSCSALYRSMSQTRVTMNVSIIMNLINVAGNYIGVYVLHQGVAGVAWPTLISRAFAAAVMFRISFVPDNPICLHMHDILCWKADIQKKILSIAVPNAVENGLFQLGRVIVTAIVTAYGTSQIAANGVANSIATLTFMTDAAMELAIVTVIGQCVGANDYDQARFYMKKMMKIAYALVIADNALTALILPWVLGFYHLGPDTSALVTRIILADCLVSSLIHSPAFVLPNGIRAAGDARYTMIVGVVSMFCVRIVGSYVLGTMLGIGVMGAWISMFLDWCVRIVCFIHRYRSGKWTQFRAI